MKKRNPVLWRKETTLAVHCLRLMLERHGHAASQHSYLVQEALGLSYSQAHRKVRGEAPWTLDELAIAAEYFGEPLRDILKPAEDYKFEEATLLSGGRGLPCQVVVGKQVEPPYVGMVALSLGGSLVVVPGDGIKGTDPSAREAREIKIGAMLPIGGGPAAVQCEALIGSPVTFPCEEPIVAVNTTHGFVIAVPKAVKDPAWRAYTVLQLSVSRPRLVTQAEPPELPQVCEN